MGDVDSVEAVYYQARLDYATEMLALLSECNNKEVAVILKKDIARAERKLGLAYEMEARADHITGQIPNVN